MYLRKRSYAPQFSLSPSPYFLSDITGNILLLRVFEKKEMICFKKQNNPHLQKLSSQFLNMRVS